MLTLLFILASSVVLWRSVHAVNVMGRQTCLRQRAACCALAVGAFGNLGSVLMGVIPSCADVVFAVGVCCAVSVARTDNSIQGQGDVCVQDR